MSSVDAPIRALAGALELRVEAMVQEMLERVTAELPSLVSGADPGLRESLLASARSQVRIGLALIGRGELPESLPHEALEEARLAAQAGIPLAEVAQSYRIAHAVLLEHLIRVLPAEGAPPEVLIAASRALFDYVDRASALVTDAYTRESDRLLRTREQRRLAVVRRVLDGAAAEPGELGWDLAGTHVGVVAWGPACAGAVAELAAAAGARALVLAPTDQSAWAWLDGRGAAGLAAPPPGGPIAGLALGDPLRGPDGFRATHHQARRAAGVGVRRGDLVVRYGDVALEALAGADPDAAREFAHRELKSLAAGGEREQLLRETLAAWLAAGHNAAAAGAALGVHERTVAYRLRTVEERLGHPPGARGAELAVALRLLGSHEPAAPKDSGARPSSSHRP